MKTEDTQYAGLPWLKNGRSREGCDCAGLAWLWLTEQAGLKMPPPRPDADVNAGDVLGDMKGFKVDLLQRGDVVFFRHKRSGKIRHVAIYLGDGKVLTTVAGAQSRIENGFALLKRVGFDPVGAVSPEDAEKLGRALADPELGWVAVIGLVISVALSLASYLLSSTATTSATAATTATVVSGKYTANSGGLAT